MRASGAHRKTGASSQERLGSIAHNGHAAQRKVVAARIVRLQRLLILGSCSSNVAHDDAAPFKAEKHAVIIDYDDNASDDLDRECLLSKYLALMLLLVLSAFIYFVLVQQYLMAAI